MKKKSLIVLIVLILSFYITLLKIDSVVALPNPQPFYYEENVTVRVNANNDSLNEIRFQGTHLNITGISEPENLFDDAFKGATYALLSVEQGRYRFDDYGNTFLHQQGDGIILSIAYVNLTQTDAQGNATQAKTMFEEAFDITLELEEGTYTDEPVFIEASSYSIFTFVADDPHFDKIFKKFWSNATDVESGFPELLNNDVKYDINTSKYTKIVMGFVNKTRPSVGKLREGFFSIEYLKEDSIDFSAGYYSFSLNKTFHHTGEISRYNQGNKISNESTINVYLPTPLEPDVIDPNLSKFYDDWSVTNGSISLTLGNNNATIENLNARFLFEEWPCLLVEKSILSVEDSYSNGDNFTVEVSITNIGKADAHNVTIDDTGRWDAHLDNETKVIKEWIGTEKSIKPNETVTFEYTLNVTDSAPLGLYLLNYSIVNYRFLSSSTSTIVELNTTSNTVTVPVKTDFPSLIITKSVSNAVYPSGEAINVSITIYHPGDLKIEDNINISEYIPGLFDRSSVSNNTSILSSQYDSGAYWVNFTLEPPSKHHSKTISYIFYPMNFGVLYLQQSNITCSYDGKQNTSQSNSLTNLVYPRFIYDEFHHHIKVKVDFDSSVNPKTTMTVNVTITNFGNSSEQYRIINRDPYRNKTQKYLDQTYGNNSFPWTLDPGESYAYNYSYYIPDLQRGDFLYAPILVVSNVSNSIDPVIALSDVEDIHINRRPEVDSVSFNATKLDRVKDTVMVEASCSDHETPRAQLTVMLRINDSDDRLYNITMTFDEKTNLFVGNFTPGAGADTGTHTFRIYATDEHDLTGRSSYYNFTVKNTKPRVEWMELYETNVTIGDTIKGSLGVKEVETPLFNLNISLYCSSPSISIVYYGTLSLFESRLVDQYYRIGTFDIEIDTSNWQEGTYDVYISIEDDKTSITYYYGEITVQRDDSPFYANPNLIFGLAYNIGVILFLIFQFRGFALLLKREIPF